MSEMRRQILRIRNSGTNAIPIYFEPWGDTGSLEPGQAYTLRADGPSGDGFEVESQEGSLTVHSWVGSTLTVLLDGELFKDF